MKRLITGILVIILLSFTVPVLAGTLYINIKNDSNPGNITVQVGTVSLQSSLLNVSLAPNQGTGVKTFNVPSGWYVVTVSWSGNNFHNINASVGSMVATCNPPTGSCLVPVWQTAGSGALGTFSVWMP